MIKKILFIFILFTFLFTSKSFGEDLQKIGKYKDWETMVLAYEKRFKNNGNWIQ